ncbi:unnamed protein product [Lampetra planeri]
MSDERDDKCGGARLLVSQKSWIEQNFSRRECCYIIPSSKDPHRCLPGCQICQQLIRCCCGRLVGQHEGPAPGLSPASSRAGLTMGVGESGADPQGSWNVERHTRCSPTDAYGIIEFQGGAHTYRSKYARVSYDSRPDLLLQLMVKEWQMELPRLLISVHGGLQNFELHPKLKQVFSKGLIKAALTTGAWIFTGGVNTGVVNHVGNALKEHASRSSHKICTIGIAPWGVIENRGDLVGQDVVSPYQTLSNPLSKLNLLNSLHSHFILVDDGTVGKYGAEAQLRRELEKHIGLQKIHTRMGQGVPVVGLVAEGGPNVIVTVLEYLLEEPPVPVVVCEGTGRAADILAFLHKNTDDTGELCDGLHDEIVGTIKKTFNFSHGQATHLLQTLLECMRRKELITVFHTGSEDHSDVDLAILTALLKGTNFSSADQLNLALAWDRVDIAKNHVFVYGQHWMVGALEKAMLDALVMDRVDFVKLLIENGVSMHKFLTITRLEELYNTKNGPINPTLYYLVRDVKKSHLPPDYKITLIDVGLVIEFLMGGAFRSMYTRKRFRLLYQNLYGQHRKFKTSTSSAMLQTNTSQIFNHRHQLFNPSLSEQESQTRHNHFLKTAQPYKRKARAQRSLPLIIIIIVTRFDPECSCFAYPFNELLAWAVLMKRQRMAMFFWQHGEESLAKALVACKLYRSLAGEAKQSEAVEDSSEELKQYSTEFGQLALDLLDQSFRQDERMAMKLLTYELRNWSNFTCLKLAVSSRHRPFVAHTCTQMLLADMWMGRLNMRKNSWFKVILSILMPPSILMLEYKSKAEMSHIPQSEELHQMGQEEREHRAAATRDIPMEVFSNGSAADGGESGHKEEEGIWIRPSGLSLSRRIYEFYHAPIVKFWFNTLAYIGFLMLFTYVVLVKLQQLPSVQEWFVILYLFMSAIERVREIFMSEPGKFGQKIKVWLDGYWNINDSLGILLFFVAVALRSQSHLLIEAKIVYSLDVIFWYVRLLDVFAVNQNVGPYIMMIGKMMANMFSIVIIMAIVLLSFGVARQAILFKEADPSWYLARNIVFQPYWMIFGEVYAPEIDACENIMKNSTDDEYPPCTAGAFITPFLQAVYLFVQYIIMVNLLIAFFNNIYLEAKNISDKLWKFHRYHFTMYYHQKPILPPPLILLSYLSLFASQLCRRCKRNPAKRKDKQSWLKLYLTEEDEKKLHEFEEHCVDLYFHGKQDTLHCSSEERIRVTSERVEGMSLQLREVSERVYCIKQSLHSLDTQLGHLQDLSALTVDTLRVLSALDRDTDPAIARQAPHSIGAHSNRQVTPPGHPASARADSRPHFHSSSPPAFWYSGVQGRRSRSLSHEKDTPSGTLACNALPLILTPRQLSPFSSLPSSQPAYPSSLTASKHRQLSLPLPSVSQQAQPGGGLASPRSNVSSMPSFMSSSTAPLMREQQPSATNSVPQQGKATSKSNRSERWKFSSFFGRRTQGIVSPYKSSLDSSYSGEPRFPYTCHDDGIPVVSIDLLCGIPCSFLSYNGVCGSLKGSINLYWKLRLVDCVHVARHLQWEPPPRIGGRVATSPPVTLFGRDVSHARALPMSDVLTTSVCVFLFVPAMERNNLMRLAQTIPFAPIQHRGDLVTVYRLEESSPGNMSNSMSSWSQRGSSSRLEFLSTEEMGGGLRKAMKVLCTWAEEGGILRQGQIYILKSFLPDVVKTWQAVYREDTILHLCLREIQQQRAAQKLLFTFNMMKPKSIPYSPRFLEVFLLYCHAAGQWFAIEEFVNGEFRKFNNNTGEEGQAANLLEESLLAFSHWTYEYTRGELLVLDLQGVGEILTDPSVIKAGEKRSHDMVFGPANLGEDAIKNFRVKHPCNSCCRKLKLPDLKRNEYTPSNIGVSQAASSDA